MVLDKVIRNNKESYILKTKAKIQKCNEIIGTVTPPSDKSISIRYAVIASMAEGVSIINNYLIGQNTNDTIHCLRQLGVKLKLEEKKLTIEGNGSTSFSEPKEPLYFGTSAATLRFIAGLTSSLPIYTVLYGAKRTNERPMDRIVNPLKEMGATINGREQGKFAPLSINGTKLKGREHNLNVSSGEVKTSLIIAGLNAKSPTYISTPFPVRDHTERMINHMGGKIVQHTKNSLTVHPLTSSLKPLNITVPTEISAAVYWFVVGSVHPCADITIQDVCMNPYRTGIIDVLKKWVQILQYQTTGLLD
jgi:3-phosphoshikimate 1-carboxyvinyltransferase